MTSLVPKTSPSGNETAPRRRDVHSLRRRAAGARSVTATRTYQPVRGGSRYIGEQEQQLWQRHNRFERSDNNAWLRSAEHIGRTTKKAGKRKGALGYVELAVLRLFLRLRGRVDGRLDPSMTWIAAELRMSRSAVGEALARLEAAGFFHRINRCEPVEDPEPGGQYVKQATNAYGREHRAIRKQLLEEEPLCQECQEQGRVTPATIADHVIPLAEGGKTERSNYRALCDACSRSKTARESARGRVKNFADRRP